MLWMQLQNKPLSTPSILINSTGNKSPHQYVTKKLHTWALSSLVTSSSTRWTRFLYRHFRSCNSVEELGCRAQANTWDALSCFKTFSARAAPSPLDAPVIAQTFISTPTIEDMPINHGDYLWLWYTILVIVTNAWLIGSWWICTTFDVWSSC